MHLLAVDPGTNRCGLAFFNHGRLVRAVTVGTRFTERRYRQNQITSEILHIIADMDGVDHVAIENPFLRGPAHQTMQRFIGSLEATINAPFTYFAPTQVKKFMGCGKMDKVEMALAAGSHLRSEEEQEILAAAIKEEAWDATDAVCIGLTFLKGGKKK